MTTEPLAENPIPAPVTPLNLVEKAILNGSDVSIVEKLICLNERQELDATRKAFVQALASARPRLSVIVKSNEVDFKTAKGRTRYKYEDLASIARAIDPVLSEFGLSYRFRAAQAGPTLTVTCIIAHTDGYSEEAALSSQIDTNGVMNGIQAIGSAATYLQRYTLKLSLGLSAANDDDAQSVKDAPADMAIITPDQYIKLRESAEAAGVDEEKLCAAFVTNSLKTFKQANYEAAIKKLNLTIKKNEMGKNPNFENDENFLKEDESHESHEPASPDEGDQNGE